MASQRRRRRSSIRDRIKAQNDRLQDIESEAMGELATLISPQDDVENGQVSESLIIAKDHHMSNLEPRTTRASDAQDYPRDYSRDCPPSLDRVPSLDVEDFTQRDSVDEGTPGGGDTAEIIGSDSEVQRDMKNASDGGKVLPFSSETNPKGSPNVEPGSPVFDVVQLRSLASDYSPPEGSRPHSGWHEHRITIDVVRDTTTGRPRPIGIQYMSNRITEVREGSQAMKKGVRIGYRMTQIGETELGAREPVTTLTIYNTIKACVSRGKPFVLAFVFPWDNVAKRFQPGGYVLIASVIPTYTKDINSRPIGGVLARGTEIDVVKTTVLHSENGKQGWVRGRLRASGWVTLCKTNMLQRNVCLTARESKLRGQCMARAQAAYQPIRDRLELLWWSIFEQSTECHDESRWQPLLRVCVLRVRLQASEGEGLRRDLGSKARVRISAIDKKGSVLAEFVAFVSTLRNDGVGGCSDSGASSDVKINKSSDKSIAILRRLGSRETLRNVLPPRQTPKHNAIFQGLAVPAHDIRRASALIIELEDTDRDDPRHYSMSGATSSERSSSTRVVGRVRIPLQRTMELAKLHRKQWIDLAAKSHKDRTQDHQKCAAVTVHRVTAQVLLELEFLGSIAITRLHDQAWQKCTDTILEFKRLNESAEAKSARAALSVAKKRAEVVHVEFLHQCLTGRGPLSRAYQLLQQGSVWRGFRQWGPECGSRRAAYHWVIFDKNGGKLYANHSIGHISDRIEARIVHPAQVKAEAASPSDGIGVHFTDRSTRYAGILDPGFRRINGTWRGVERKGTFTLQWLPPDSWPTERKKEDRKVWHPPPIADLARRSGIPGHIASLSRRFDSSDIVTATLPKWLSILRATRMNAHDAAKLWHAVGTMRDAFEDKVRAEKDAHEEASRRLFVRRNAGTSF